MATSTGTGKKPANLYSIDPGLPFLGTLAQSLITGGIIEGFRPSDDPSSLSDCTIFLPTRRAARALSLEIHAAMQEHTGRQATILPRIRTLGDSDEEEILPGFYRAAASRDELVSFSPGKVSDPVERRLMLAVLAKGWITSMSAGERLLLGEEIIVLPSSSADAVRISNDLAEFMDQVETEEVDWKSLANIVPEDEDYAQWWQLTHRFLSIIMSDWPGLMAERGEISPSAYRRELARFRGEALQSGAFKGPVIAAGSTGSIPSTARLLKVISELDDGAVVLPGVDCSISPDIFKLFDFDTGHGGNSILSSHPQFGIGRLLHTLGVVPQDVKTLGKPEADLANRVRILHSAMLPSSHSHLWADLANRYEDTAIQSALNNVALIEAESERLEALAISIVMREALETPGKTAALVTPDRKLARRVSTELERFGIQIDDTAGDSLSASRPARFCRLLLRAASQSSDPIPFSSLLKSDLLLLGRSAGESRRLGELLELVVLRGTLKLPSIRDLASTVLEVRQDLPVHADPKIKSMDDEAWQELSDFADQLATAIAPLTQAFDNGLPITAGQLCCHLLETAVALTADENGVCTLFNHSGGDEIQAFFASHSRADQAGFEFDFGEAAAVLDALLEGGRVREGGRTHSRLHIYGQLEARLQSCDLMILGSLNEGSWPQSVTNDPFLNRPMRSELGLPLPERRTGLAAHDFCQFSGCKEVVYTRSARKDDAPTIASRWIQRLETFVGPQGRSAMISRGERILAIARQIDQPGNYAPIQRPKPIPPVSARPRALSITEIETWIRDPYSIYAKHILGLRPLPSLITKADPAMRGNLYHEIFGEFIKAWDLIPPDQRRQKLREIADHCFAKSNLGDETVAAWRPRFDDVADSFMFWEANRRASIRSSFCEISGKMIVGETGFELRGRADRIDVTQEGKLVIIDYKTGTNPSKKMARSLSPQLSLEGAMANAGAFEKIGKAPVDELLYVRLRAGDKFDAENISTGRDLEEKSAMELAQIAHDRLIKHILDYQNPDQPYVSRYAPVSEKEMNGDYDHLARVREWSIGDDPDLAGDSE